MLRHDFEGANRIFKNLLTLDCPAWWHRLAADACEQVRRDADACEFNEAALRKSFMPDAHLALARLALLSKNRASAEHHALASLNSKLELGEKAQIQENCLIPALGILLNLEKPMPALHGFIGTIRGEKASFLAGRSFLIFARDKEHAKEFLIRLIQTVVPGEPATTAPEFRLTSAAPGQEPRGAVSPGIHRIWT